MAGADVRFQFLAHDDSVHDRHHDVADHNVGNGLCGYMQSFFSVGGGFYLIQVRKCIRNVVAYVGIVFHHQDNRAGIFIFICHFLFLNRLFFLSVLLVCMYIFSVQGLRIGIACRQAQIEGRADFRQALYLNVPFVQLHQVFHQCQSDACSGSLMFSALLIIAFEDMCQSVLSDTIAGVFYGQLRIAYAIFRNPFGADTDISFFCVFQRIGNQVVQNHGDDFLVEEQHHVFLFHLYQNLNLRLVVQFLVFQSGFIDRAGQVPFCHTQSLVLCFCLPEVQYLVYQIQ